MKFTYNIAEKYLFCTLKGRLDAATAAEFIKNCQENIPQTNKLLILDCSGLTYISSSGLRCLLMLSKRLAPRKVYLCNVQDEIREIITMAGFYKFIPVCNSFEEAVAKANEL